MKKGAKKLMEKNNTELNISIEEKGWETALPDFQELSNKVMQKTIDFVQNHDEIDFLSLNKTISVNLSLSNDENIHKLNLEFRNMDKPTNVLSFANIDDPFFEEQIQTDDIIELGDIMIALETMQREAKEKEISLHDHYCHLFIHGILHLLGFDHIEDDEAEYMEDFEVRILAELNIANPYQE